MSELKNYLQKFEKEMKKTIVHPPIIARLWDGTSKEMFNNVAILKTGVKYLSEGKLNFLSWGEVNFEGFKSANFTFMLGFYFDYRNGHELYEGDILKIESGTEQNVFDFYLVSYRSNCFMADNIKNGKDDKNGFEIWDTIVWHDLMEGGLLIEKIGNVYKDKELYEKLKNG